MTRRAIDIDDETWRRIKVEAAEHGITVKQVVIGRLRAPVQWASATLPPHMEVAGYCQRDGEAWPCAAVTPPDLSESLE